MNELTEQITENVAKRSVLIVEDNEINREMLRGILEDRYRVIDAVDGLDGLEKLREHFRSLSLILLDVQMPRMNGYEFLETVRKDKLLSSVPVIVTTGSTISEDEEKCLALGASDFVTKPYNPRVILRRIEAIIRLHESIATLQAIEYDELTGLYNKSAFHHHVDRLLQMADGAEYDMLLLNIEDFSYINERYGETAANELLKHIAGRLRVCATEACLVCRYHADHFLLLREHREDDRETLVAAFDGDIHEGAPIPDFVIKYAAYDKVDPTLPVSLMYDRLILALKTIARQYNRRIVTYDASMSDRINRLRKIGDCMKDALKKKQFKVYYQPKHDVKTGKIAGAEALVRWIHPELGFISPGDFIPLFEENGFITDLDRYVYDTVCADLRAWQDEGISPVPVSVNASRRDFLTITDTGVLTAPLEKYNVEKKYLHIEITESLCVADALVFDKVRTVHDLGFRIELDDFGSGQSSLGTISDIPMDVIKLDISFARALEKQKEIVRMIISLAHALGLKTVAEGVETKEQVATLKKLKCDTIQGYYYSKPLPEADFRSYLASHEHTDAE